MDTELKLAVDSLFEEYFMPAFLGSGEDGLVSKAVLMTLINEKFEGDESL